MFENCADKIVNLFLLLVVSFTFAGNLRSQSQASNGQITGRVTDGGDANLPNALIQVVNRETGVERTATTSKDGIYTIILLPPGKYNVSAQSSGFAASTAVVEVQVGRTTDANFILGPGNVSAEVTITAESVQTTRSESDAVINETAINNLPINGRRFQDFAILTPTAQIEQQRGQISLAGQRGINANINVDGVDYNQPFFGGIRGGERSNEAFTLPQEAVREFQVIAAGYSPEFGRSSGGLINVVTKSGTNDLRGSAFYQIRPRQLARNSEYVQAIETFQQILNPNFVSIPAPTLQQFGGSFGGAIIKNKFFFFGAYEQQRFRAPRQIVFNGLTAGILDNTTQEGFEFLQSLQTSYKQTNDAYAVLGRVDWEINSSNRLSGRYNYSQNRALNASATGSSIISPNVTRALSNNGTERDRNNILVSQLVSSFGQNALNEFRFQFAREDRPREANEISPTVNVGGIGTYGTVGFLPTVQFDKRSQFADGFTLIRGNQTIKFGGEFSNIHADQTFGFNQTGSFGVGGSPQSALRAISLTPGIATDRRFDDLGNSYAVQTGNLRAAYDVQELAFFAQNSWRVFPNLTLDLGLRAEQQYNPTPETNNQALIDLVRNAQFPVRGGRGIDVTDIPDSSWQFAPRFGFAYDPKKNGKTVLRGFTGLFYARTPLILFADPFNNYRTPPGNLSAGLPVIRALPSSFSQATFDAANPQYVAIVGPGVAPTTVYRNFAVAGINLNNFRLNNLPILTPQQVTGIASAINNGITNSAQKFDPRFAGLAPFSFDENFKNPRAFQLGFGFEHEILKGIVVGADYLQVKTTRLQRNRELNLPAPVSLTEYAQTVAGLTQAQRSQLIALDSAQRPIIGIVVPTGFPGFFPTRPRPVPQLGSVQIRESQARSLYRAINFRVRFTRKWGQFNAYYTLSRNKSDDDNERGGSGADNTFDLRPEYNLSDLDRTHQFVANPVFFLPFGFEAASSIRLRSGNPINVQAGADLNGDTTFNDRPYVVPEIPFRRNVFRNRNLYEVDVRVQKGFKFTEIRRLVISAEFFNVLNLSNIQLTGFRVTNYCPSATPRCGLDGATNPTFLQVRDQSGNLITTENRLGTAVFQMQLGVRFQF